MEPPDYPNDAEPFPSFDASGESLPLRRAQGGGPGGQTNPWVVGVAIAILLGAVSIVSFGLFGPSDDDGGTATSAGSTSTTLTDGTTEPSDTGATTDSTGSSDTTGSSDSTPDTTGSTVTLPSGDIGPIVPIGDPIPIEELLMKADGIGDFPFGTAGDDVLGRFVATFGEPTDDTGFLVGDGSWGECSGDLIRVVRWGPLNLVTRGSQNNHEFVSYRIDVKYAGIDSPAANLETLSGLQILQTVGDLQNTYEGLVVEFRTDATAGIVFELRASRDGDLLLWGPVESADTASLVTGIYSPDSCTDDGT